MQWNNSPPPMPDYVQQWTTKAATQAPGSQDALLCQCSMPRKIAMTSRGANAGKWYAACPKPKGQNCERSFCWIMAPGEEAPQRKRARDGNGTTYSVPAAVGIPDDVKLAIVETRGDVKDLRTMVETKLLPMMEMLMAAKDENCPAGK